MIANIIKYLRGRDSYSISVCGYVGGAESFHSLLNKYWVTSTALEGGRNQRMHGKRTLFNTLYVHVTRNFNFGKSQTT